MPATGVVIRLNLIPNCINNLPGEARKIIGDAMDYAVQVEQDNVAVETGSLQATIHAEWTGETSGVVTAGGGTRAVTGEPIDYTGFQEYGTMYNAAHPFVRPAADAAAHKLDDAVNIEAGLLA